MPRGNTQHGLFVYSGDVTVEDLTLQNMLAKGGGALGAGGDIFVEAGASLTIAGTDSVGTRTVTGGAAGHGAQAGQAFASSVDLQGNTTMAFAPTGVETIAGVISDDTGSTGR